MNEIINIELSDNDVIQPCPFCGCEEIELHNTWTAAYWLECAQCGCEMYDTNQPGEAESFEAHVASKEAVIAGWNRRVSK